MTDPTPTTEELQVKCDRLMAQLAHATSEAARQHRLASEAENQLAQSRRLRIADQRSREEEAAYLNSYTGRLVDENQHLTDTIAAQEREIAALTDEVETLRNMRRLASANLAAERKKYDRALAQCEEAVAQLAEFKSRPAEKVTVCGVNAEGEHVTETLDMGEGEATTEHSYESVGCYPDLAAWYEPDPDPVEELVSELNKACEAADPTWVEVIPPSLMHPDPKAARAPAPVDPDSRPEYMALMDCEPSPEEPHPDMPWVQRKVSPVTKPSPCFHPWRGIRAAKGGGYICTKCGADVTGIVVNKSRCSGACPAAERVELDPWAASTPNEPQAVPERSLTDLTGMDPTSEQHEHTDEVPKP